MAPENIIEKVRKLLKLAEGTSNEHEAASAAAQAQRMMDANSISAAMLDNADDDEPDEEVREFNDPIANAGARWRGQLANVIAKANACGVYRSGKSYFIYGRPSDADAVRYVFEFCRREVDRLAARKRGEGRTWLNNYRMGCVEAVRDAIAAEQKALRDEMRAEANATNALVPLDKALAVLDERKRSVQTFANAKLNLRSSGNYRTRSNPSARAMGRRDGASIYGGSSGARRVGAGSKRIDG